MTEDEKGTFGLNSQDVHEIKEHYYGDHFSIDDIAIMMNVSVAQVMYAVNLNETELQTF